MKINNFAVFSLLWIFWTILAEGYSTDTLLVGMIVSVVITYLNNLIFNRRINKFSITICIDYLFFFVVLLIEIFKSNINVAKIVLSKDMNLQPAFVKLNTNLHDPLLKTLLANGITLTPGTLTVSVDGQVFTIHTLFKNESDELVNSKLEKILMRIEEKRELYG